MESGRVFGQQERVKRESVKRAIVARAFVSYLLAFGISAGDAECQFAGFLKMWNNLEYYAETPCEYYSQNTEANNKLFAFLCMGGFGNESVQKCFERLSAEFLSSKSLSICEILRQLLGRHAAAVNESILPGTSDAPRNENYAGDSKTGPLLEMMGSLKAVLGKCVFAKALQLPWEEDCRYLVSLLMSLVSPDRRKSGPGSFIEDAVKAITTQAKHLSDESGCTQLEALKAVLGNGEGTEELLAFKRIVALIVDIAQKVVDDNPELVAEWKRLDILVATHGI